MPNPWYKPLKRWREHRRARSSLELFRSSDPEHQAELQPPDEERIQCRVIVVAEAYGPMDSARFIAAMRKLDIGGLGIRSPTESAQTSRRVTRANPTHELGILVPRSQSPHPFFQVAAADLPTGVRAAIPSLTTLGGSVSVLHFTFLLEENLARAPDRALRRYHPTIPVPNGRGYWPPEMSQRDAVRISKQALRESMASWVSTTFPGTFTRLERPLPSAHLQTYRTKAAEREWSMTERWVAGLDMPRVDAWRSTVHRALTMAPGRADERAAACLHLVARESHILPRINQHGGSLDEAAGWWLVVQKLSKTFGGTMALWTALCLLSAYDERLAAFRDTLSPEGVRASLAARRLRTIAEHLREITDMRAVTRDLSAPVDARVFQAWDGNEWVARSRFRLTRSNRFIADNLAYLGERASSISEREEILRQRLSLEVDLLPGPEDFGFNGSRFGSHSRPLLQA